MIKDQVVLFKEHYYTQQIPRQSATFGFEQILKDALILITVQSLPV